MEPEAPHTDSRGHLPLNIQKRKRKKDITMAMAKQIVVTVVVDSNGDWDDEATLAAFQELYGKGKAEHTTDFDSVATEVATYLLQNPALRTISTKELHRSIWDTRVESGTYKGKSSAEKNAAWTRLETVLPEYLKSNQDLFHVGKKVGVAIRYVPGEQALDKEGNPRFDAEGNPVQHYRISDEDWAKLTAKRDELAAAAQ